MQRAFGIVFGLLASMTIAAAADERPAPKQAERGRELFLKSAKGTACGTCHAIGGVGRDVGPDLKRMASLVAPRGLVMAIQMTVTAYVQEVRGPGGVFPGIQKQKRGDEVEIWDLSKSPPELRTLASKQVVSMSANRTWKHPPASAGYTPQELADLIGFLKWAATGQRTEVKVADVE